MRRARAEMARADRVLFMIDAAADPQAARLRRGTRAACRPASRSPLVFNKCDPACRWQRHRHASAGRRWLHCPRATGNGLDGCAHT